MRTIVSIMLATVTAAAVPAVANAQTRKPAPKPAVRTPAKPAASPTAKPAPAATPTPAAAPAPKPAPAATSSAKSSSAGDSPFDVGTNVVNLGIGLGSRYSYGFGGFGGNSSVSPAVSVSFERGILPIGPGILGVGGIIGYQSASYEYSGFKDKFTDLIVMVRGAFHYPVTSQFDAYAGVGIGVRRLSYSSNYSGPYTVDYGSTGATSGLFVGGRYYFTPSIGAFAELGYDQTYLKAGLAVKF